MDTKDTNPLSRFERQKTNYPLIAAVLALFVVLAAGLGLAARAQEFVSAILFLAASAGLVIIILINLATNRRLAAVDDRKFIHWDAAMPELQRQNVNVEVRELGKLLGLAGD